MDANQVGFVHELTLDDVKTLLDDSLSITPRRQMTVQFSGGEPTLSPIFLDAVAYAKQIGYFSVQATTNNGIRFAQDPAFAHQAREAGLRIAYLQFDGVGEEANAHRKVGNLFDVKLRAIEHLYEAGIDGALVARALVATIVNTVNHDQVGRIVKFAVANCDKISFVSFQPVSFTGRGRGHRRRNAPPPAVHAVAPGARQTGVLEPLRDWFPLSAASALSDATDLIQGPGADWVGDDEVRLPPELRRGHGADSQPGRQVARARQAHPGAMATGSSGIRAPTGVARDRLIGCVNRSSLRQVRRCAQQMQDDGRPTSNRPRRERLAC